MANGIETTKAQVTRMFHKVDPTPIGEKVARRIEEKFSKPYCWLDLNHQLSEVGEIDIVRAADAIVTLKQVLNEYEITFDRLDEKSFREMLISIMQKCEVNKDIRAHVVQREIFLHFLKPDTV